MKQNSVGPVGDTQCCVTLGRRCFARTRRSSERPTRTTLRPERRRPHRAIRTTIGTSTGRKPAAARSLGWAGWAGLGWAGLGWAGLGWAGLGWAGLGWAGLGWAGLGWAGLAGLGWAGLGWAGLGWAGLGWAGRKLSIQPNMAVLAMRKRVASKRTGNVSGWLY
jgi:hypothetical protein